MDFRKRFISTFLKTTECFSQKICLFWVYDLKRTLGITYSSLNFVSDELNDYLSRFLKEDDRYVGVELSENFFLPIFLLAIWKGGRSFAGIGTQYRREDTLNYLDELPVNFFITDNDRSELMQEDTITISCLAIGDQKFYLCERKARKNKNIHKHWDLCYGIMTSGSTGLPKIIQVPWSCIWLNIEELMEEFNISDSDCIFQSSPCTFDPFFVEIFLVLINGSSLLIVSNAIKLTPSELLKILFFDDNRIVHVTEKSRTKPDAETHIINLNYDHVTREPITVLQMTPSIFKRWSENDLKEIVLSDKSSLKLLILGGEKFPGEILKLKAMKNKSKIYNIYGTTEISCWAFLNDMTSNHDCNAGSIGKPLKHIKFKINDKNELLIGSSTRVCLINNECCDDLNRNETVYRSTGDIFQLKNDNLIYLRRSDQIIKKFGMRIDLKKIEETFLAGNRETLSNCVCIFNEYDMKLGLFYTGVNESSLNYKLQSIENFIKSGHFYPKEELNDIEKPDCLVEMSKLPLNSHGKMNKKQLFDIFKSILSSSRFIHLKSTFQNIWNDVLGLQSSQANSKSFIELGGNSVLALQLSNKLENVGIKVPQDFIVDLLNGSSQDVCLRRLEADYNEWEPKKRRKEYKQSVELAVKWKFDLGKCIDASPRIFSREGNKKLVVGSHSSRLACICLESGKAFWTVRLGGRIESGVEVTNDGSTGFVGSYDRNLYCLSLDDGSFLWKFETGDIIKSTPCLSTDEKKIFVASYDRLLYSLAADDGRLLNRVTLSDKGIYSSGIVCSEYNNLYIATLDGTCIALCQTSEQVRWKNKLRSPVFASPCLSHGSVIFAEVAGVVHCLNAVDGSTVWQYKAEGCIYSSPTLHLSGGSSFVTFGSHDRNVHCLRISGEKVNLEWKREIGSPIFARVCVFHAIQGNLLMAIVSTQGVVYISDARSGIIIGRHELDGEVFSSPVHSNEVLFMGCRDNYVYAVRAVSNEQ